jgi:preprotein translocase subunit SecD
MLNQYPLWKNLLIVFVLLLASVYALPNLYGEDPALQLTSARAGKLDAGLPATVIGALEDAGLAYKSIESDEYQILVRFQDTETQLKAVDYVKASLGTQYIVALNLAPATPGWLQSINALPMYLGLDLRGGVYFLMDVDMEAAISQAIERYTGDFRSLLRGEKIRYVMIRAEDDGVRILFRNPADRDRAETLIRKESPDLVRKSLDGVDGKSGLFISLSDLEVREILKFALQQNILTLRNRVNEIGVAEPVIQQQGTRRIVVQLPGVQDTARAKRILGATATLEYRAVDTEHENRSL